MVCRARGARRPLLRRSQFHAGAALTARKAQDASALAARAAPNERTGARWWRRTNVWREVTARTVMRTAEGKEGMR